MAIDSDMICIQIYMYDKIWCKHLMTSSINLLHQPLERGFLWLQIEWHLRYIVCFVPDLLKKKEWTKKN